MASALVSLCIFLYSCLIPCILVYFIVFLCMALYSSVFHCIPVYFFVFLCMALYFCVFLCILVYFFVFLCISLYFCVFLSILVYFFLFLCISLYLLCIIFQIFIVSLYCTLLYLSNGIVLYHTEALPAASIVLRFHAFALKKEKKKNSKKQK